MVRPLAAVPISFVPGFVLGAVKGPGRDSGLSDVCPRTTMHRKHQGQERTSGNTLGDVQGEFVSQPGLREHEA